MTVAVLAAAALSSTGVASAAAPAPSCGGSPITLRGTDRSETLRGTAGRDVIDARGGNDRVFGAGGDDVICGGAGNDLVDAGAGNDRVLGGDGDDRLLGSSGRDVLEGGNGKDSLDGGAGDDVLAGGAGNDLLSGGAGDDRLAGGGDADRLDGGAGSDVLSGGAGDDRLDGGRGGSADRDALTSGAGRDTVLVRPGDRVTDRGATDTVAPLPRTATQPAPVTPAPVTPAPVTPAPVPPPVVPPVQPPPVVVVPQQPVSDKGIVEGVVRGPDGEPVTGIRVTVGDTEHDSAERATTDALGRWSVSVAPRSYLVEFEDVEGDLVDTWNGGVPRELAASFTVAAGARVVQDVQLKQGHPVSGQVTSGGTGVAGLRVSARSTGNGIDYVDTETRSDGTYTLHGVPTGTYHVSVDAPDFRYRSASYLKPGEEAWITRSVVGVDTTVIGIDVQVELGRTATGRVEDAAGNGIAGAFVSGYPLLGGGGGADGHTMTDEHGDYVLPGLGDGPYRLSVHAQGFLPFFGSDDDPDFVVDGADLTVPTVEMQLGTSVSGRVLLDGRPVAGARVHHTDSLQSTSTAADGTFVLAGIPAGRHVLRVEDGDEIGTEYFGDVPAEGDAVDTTEGDRTGVVITVTPGRSLGGRVTTGGSTPVPGATVRVAGANGEVYASASVSSDGQWVARGLPTGSVLVSASAPYEPGPFERYLTEWFGGAYTAETAAPLTTTVQRTDVDIDLDEPAPTTITVTSATTTPVDVPLVLSAEVFDQAGTKLWQQSVTWSEESATATIDGDELTATAPGTVQVTATAGTTSRTFDVLVEGPVTP